MPQSLHSVHESQSLAKCTMTPGSFNFLSAWIVLALLKQLFDSDTLILVESFIPVDPQIDTNTHREAQSPWSLYLVFWKQMYLSACILKQTNVHLIFCDTKYYCWKIRIRECCIRSEHPKYEMYCSPLPGLGMSWALKLVGRDEDGEKIWFSPSQSWPECLCGAIDLLLKWFLGEKLGYKVVY